MPKVSEEFCKKFPEFSTLGAQLLYNRGFQEQEQAQKFIDPKYDDLNSPFLFTDMQKAVDRIWSAIENKESICVYGDYDADAVTANAVLQQTFRYLGVETDNYIPDRFTEGYGLNLEAFQKIKERGAKLVITVDCGTNSTDAADWCLENGIDLIITDHHEVIGYLPKAYALINPKNPNDKYPYYDITGVGVAFKLACGILSRHDKVTTTLSLQSKTPSSPSMDLISQRRREGDEVGPGHKATSSVNKLTSSPQGEEAPQKSYTGGFEKWLLDLVAIGTVADCHSLLGENRILVKFGLKVLAKTRWVGLKSLMTTAGIDPQSQTLDTYTLGFIIAPRLNAAGRLEHASIALHLLLEKDPLKAVERASELDKINVRRQEHTKNILSEAKEQLIKIGDRKVLIVLGDWNKGVVGLVAGRIAEEYHKPTMVLSRDGAEATGSARTVGEFNVVESLKHASEHLTRFGGHQQAAGLTLKVDDFELFYQKILDYAEENLTEDDLESSLTLEAELTAAQSKIF